MYINIFFFFFLIAHFIGPRTTYYPTILHCNTRLKTRTDKQFVGYFRRISFPCNRRWPPAWTSGPEQGGYTSSAPIDVRKSAPPDLLGLASSRFHEVSPHTLRTCTVAPVSITPPPLAVVQAICMRPKAETGTQRYAGRSRDRAVHLRSPRGGIFYASPEGTGGRSSYSRAA